MTCRRVPRPRTLLAVVAVLVVLGTAACGEDDGGAATPPPLNAGVPDDLDGATFTSTAVDGRDLAAGSSVTISFDSGQLTMNAGCNTIGGAYTITARTLTLDAGARSTRMACERSLMDQDEFLTDWLQAGVDWRLDGNALTLDGQGVRMRLEGGDT
jgi:heat shock protein HslJ